MIDTVLFDLDGTLTDPGEGITDSVAYALRTFGIEVTDRTELYCFIGPPLKPAFMKYYGFTPEQADAAVAAYREFFRETGMFRNRVFDGIPELLAALRTRGIRTVIATSKPEEFSLKILDHFDLAKYFDRVTGATFDGRISTKDQVVAEALRRDGIDPDRAIMVGDRYHDIEGGKAHGLRTLGVTFGYGDREEHAQAGADHIADSVEELGEILMRLTEADAGSTDTV